VTYTCQGFEYRGQCRHARDVKGALGGQSRIRATCEENDTNTPITPNPNASIKSRLSAATGSMRPTRL
jgi:hypothetical protein